METTKSNSDFDQSSQEGESRPTSGVGSYEDDFEKGLEGELSCSYEDDKFEDLVKNNNSSPYGFSNHSEDHDSQWNGLGNAPVVLDHSSHRDCDEDLENELTYGLLNHVHQRDSNGHFYHFERDEDNRMEGRRGSRFLEFFRKRGMYSSKDGQADSFFDAAEEVGYDSTPDSGVHESLQNMDPAQRARQEEELRNELAKTEEEIQTLRSVLAAKLRHSQDLKTKLGITVWREFRDDMEQGLKNVKESDMLREVNDKLYQFQQALASAPLFQKTETVFKTAGEKTTTVLGTFGATVSKKLGEVKNSETFKSFEEKVGSAYTNVKTKVSGSRSNSMQSFDEALANAEGRTSSATTPATTPMIPEDKPLL